MGFDDTGLGAAMTQSDNNRRIAALEARVLRLEKELRALAQWVTDSR